MNTLHEITSHRKWADPWEPDEAAMLTRLWDAGDFAQIHDGGYVDGDGIPSPRLCRLIITAGILR